MAQALAAQDKGNMGAVFNDCGCTAPKGIKYIEPNAKEVNQGKILRDEAAVKRAQEALGLKGDKQDGMWGRETTIELQKKLEKIQSDSGLTANGRYSAETAIKMRQNPETRALAEALDAMRNRDVLDRVYKPLKKEEIACDVNGVKDTKVAKPDVAKPEAPVAAKPATEAQELARRGRAPQEPTYSMGNPVEKAGPVKPGGAEGGQFVQPVARFTHDGNFGNIKEAPAGHATGNGRYLPGQGDVRTDGMKSITPTEIAEGARRLFDDLMGKPTVASQGGVKPPPLATPGILPEQGQAVAAIKFDTLKQ